MKGLTTEWIRKAEKDFLVAKRDFSADPPEYDAVSFHSQQCVEKYLKAILQENEVFFGKTHDLDVLLEKSKIFIPELFNLKIKLIELSSKDPGMDKYYLAIAFEEVRNLPDNPGKLKPKAFKNYRYERTEATFCGKSGEAAGRSR